MVLLALLLSAPAALAGQPKKSVPKAKKPPVLSLYAKRALRAYEAMQQNFYVPSAGLYKGEPEYSFLWPFSQAFAASVSVAHIPRQRAHLEGSLRALAAGLQVYASSPAARRNDRDRRLHRHDARSFDDVTAPPVGPGGASYYDDNEWVGIELARMYELDHYTAALTRRRADHGVRDGRAGRPSAPKAGRCPAPGGCRSPTPRPTPSATRSPTVPPPSSGCSCTALTHEARYLQFAEEAYGWVRGCLLEPTGLYADHIELDGKSTTRCGATPRA